MKISFLGTGAAEGIPALFCNCDYCKAAKKAGGKQIRSRAQVIIDGELAIDFPPDAFYHAAAFRVDLSALKYLLVTHSHMDHFYAHDFILRGYKYAHEMSSPSLEIFGNEEVAEVFSECTRRELREDVGANISMHTMYPFEEVCFGNWRINSLKARHSSKEPLLYLVERAGKRYLHLCDTGKLPDENYEFLAQVVTKPLDLITFDCTFLFDKTPDGARHMGLDENKRTVKKLESLGLADGHTQKVITHFSHNCGPSEKRLKEAEEQFGYIAAYDGLTIKI